MGESAGERKQEQNRHRAEDTEKENERNAPSRTLSHGRLWLPSHGAPI